MSERGYPARLAGVLRSRDALRLQAFLVEQAQRYGDDAQVAAVRSKGPDEMTELLHRMTLARADLSTLHLDSRRWLSAHRPTR